MSYVITFTDFTPSPRYDGLPWTHATIEEAPEQDGVWTQLADITLDPVDTDPAEPAARDFTVDNATLSAGWYRITFLDAAGDSQPADPIYHASRGPFLPSIADVATYIRNRTRNNNGAYIGTFDGTTQPTADQVRRLIADADAKVAARFGSDLPEPLRAKVRVVNALRAAMFVELSYFGDQIAANRSPYNELKKLHDEEFTELVSDWKLLGGDQQPGTDDDTSDQGAAVIAETVDPYAHACGSESPWPASYANFGYREDAW